MKAMLNRNGRWIVAVTLNLIFITIVAVLNTQFAVKLAGYITILYVAVALIPIRIKGWKLFPEDTQKVLLRLQVQRRDFGITAAFMVITHAFLALYYYGGLSFGVLDPSFYLNPEILPGFLAEGILLLMLVTSHGRLTRALGKRWKPIHRLVWVAVGLAMVHTFAAADKYTTENTGLAATVILSIISLTAVADLFIRIRRKQEISIQLTTLSLLGGGLLSALLINALL